MLKKIMNLLIVFTLLIGICGNVYAEELETKLEIIKKSSKTEYLENDQGYISKSIIDSNAETGEVTIELNLNNEKKEAHNRKTTEIFIVFDNSTSMDEEIMEGVTRREKMIETTKKIVTKIFENSTNVRVGFIKFSSQYNGIFNEKNYEQPNAATLISDLSSDKQRVFDAIEEYEETDTEAGTNIYAGLKMATEKFSANDNNKVIILLTDGFPTEFEETYDDDLYVKDSACNKTKQYIQSMDSEITLISVLTGTTNESDVTKVFGTEKNPNKGYFYNVQDAEIETKILSNVLSNVLQIIQKVINDVKVVDYFPEDITKNFEFSYIGNPTVGTISETINEKTRTISWDIGTLKGDEVATLKYKLKIKDMKNIDLLNKTIATNEKVVLTYKDIELKDYTLELTSSPKIQLSEVKEELTATVTYDPTSNTTGKVTATIKTNKKVEEVEGWTLSEDGKTLTKKYSKNTTETVYLTDKDNMTKEVKVKISNIVENVKDTDKDTDKDKTQAPDKLPQAGLKTTIYIVSVIMIAVALIKYKKYSKLKDIK